MWRVALVSNRVDKAPARRPQELAPLFVVVPHEAPPLLPEPGRGRVFFTVPAFPGRLFLLLPPPGGRRTVAAAATAFHGLQERFLRAPKAVRLVVRVTAVLAAVALVHLVATTITIR